MSRRNSPKFTGRARDEYGVVHQCRTRESYAAHQGIYSKCRVLFKFVMYCDRRPVNCVVCLGATDYNHALTTEEYGR